MPNLTHLGISNGLLEDADLTGPDSFLQHFKGLKSLSLNGNLLTEFDASRHLPDNVRSTLESLSLAYNPLTETNLDGIDLPVLPIQSTRITVLDDAVLSMENLQHFSWRNDHLTNEGLGDGDAVGAFARYPETLRVSHHTDMLGNPFDSDDTGIEAEAVVVQIAHADRMKEINDAAGGKVVLDRFLGDPCRPQIDIFDTFQQWSEAGDLCLTPAQTSEWVASLDGFNGLQSVRALGLDLTDDQAGTLLDNIDGKPILTIQIAGAPDAFGAGFIDSKLDAFDSLGWLRELYINGTQLTLNQAKEILGKLKAKYISDGSPAKHFGLSYLDLSYHPHLFAAASVDDVSDFLDGVTTTDDSQWPDFRLGLRETGLTFPDLKAIIDSMDDDVRLRHLDVSSNPSLWTGATDPEFTALFERMKGVTSIDVGHTGMTGNRASLMFNALAGNGGTEVDTSGGNGKASVKHSLARMTFLGLDGNDLSTGIELDTAFGLFAGRYPSSEGTLSYLGLEETKIGFNDLANIVTGLVNAELVDQIRHLRLERSNEVWSDPAATQTGITNLFAKFHNLRVLILNDSGISLEQLG